MNRFPKEVYIARRQKLKQLMGTGVLLFLGNEESSMNFKDNWYPFRQDSTFLYFFGLDMSGLTGIIHVDEDQEVIFGDDISTEDSVWFGTHPALQELADSVGVDRTRPKRDVAEVLKDIPLEHVHILPPYRPENLLKLSEWLGISTAAVSQQVSEGFIQSVVALRSIKAESEIEEISRAVDLSVRMHKALMREARAGMYEYELLGLVLKEAASGGGSVSFPPIITTRGQILHNHDYSHQLREGGMLLGDFGAESAMHYAGDITRTIPVGSVFSSQQKEIYQMVLDAYQVAVQALRPGVFFKDVHLLACRTLAEGLKSIGLMKGDLDEAVVQGAHALFFQCGLGHMMGMDVHDMEDLGEPFVGYTDTLKKSTQFGLRSLRLGKQLETGFVLTIEPGLYFIPQLMDQWEAAGLHKDFIDYKQVAHFRDFGGIRVEDAYQITPVGAKVLGDPLEITVSEVETLRSTVGIE
ncbi:MAG: aminopeptidase P family protein [Lunatimonas sp.]|uniref:aminopeptidase P family protein n=1 Tax=Lunatimonas sp. TaxID=2060141 RepID=UPI00263BBA87|nr:aminopeptidase P family protein [Lunatimonas sp.]MCC5939199.1 aminopeptidase P family protein [Lunatimonas sp.]